VPQPLAPFDILRCAALVAALLACSWPPSSALAQEVYRSVDAQGHVTYSDRGSSKNAPKTSIKVNEPDPAEVERLAKEQQLLSAEDSQRAKQEALEAKNKAAADRNKQQSCERARNNYYRLKDAGRIYQRDADGNRVYYSDAESDTLREKARQAMLSACGN
jgi:multidrug efflux pump subunit AcrA (membrane-fusion protein)